MPKDVLHTIIKPIKVDLKNIEAIIRKSLSDVHTPLESMLRYSLTGGKRLRPALVVLTGRLFKPNKRKINVLAAAVEVLHSATLIHDDLVDNSSLRRGRRTLNATWPPGATVLAGDYLLARSVSLIAGLNEPRLLGILADTLYTMSQGEITYHYSGECKKDRRVYFRSIEAKTAALFSAAVQMAAVLSGRTCREINTLGVFGREFGIAYQIVDDVLDYVGTEKELGKPAGSDIADGVITLPAICYLERNPEDKTIDRIISGRTGQREINTFLVRVRKSGAIEDALDEARSHARKSKNALAKIPAVGARQILCDLIDYIVERTH
jgi:geranylgeranyl pyrophosphate synthase